MAGVRAVTAMGPRPEAGGEPKGDGRLHDWWRELGRQEAELALDKAAEYGSIDLQLVGRGLELLTGTDAREPEELGIAFYVLGKVARVISAYRAGARASDDTWRDIAIYAKMAQRVRQTGRWP